MCLARNLLSTHILGYKNNIMHKPLLIVYLTLITVCSISPSDQEKQHGTSRAPSPTHYTLINSYTFGQTYAPRDSYILPLRDGYQIALPKKQYPDEKNFYDFIRSMRRAIIDNKVRIFIIDQHPVTPKLTPEIIANEAQRRDYLLAINKNLLPEILRNSCNVIITEDNWQSVCECLILGLQFNQETKSFDPVSPFSGRRFPRAIRRQRVIDGEVTDDETIVPLHLMAPDQHAQPH